MWPRLVWIVKKTLNTKRDQGVNRVKTLSPHHWSANPPPCRVICHLLILQQRELLRESSTFSYYWSTYYIEGLDNFNLYVIVFLILYISRISSSDLVQKCLKWWVKICYFWTYCNSKNHHISLKATKLCLTPCSVSQRGVWLCAVVVRAESDSVHC